MEQFVAQVGSVHASRLRHTDMTFLLQFLGECTEGFNGPYRECISTLCEELESSRMRCSCCARMGLREALHPMQTSLFRAPQMTPPTVWLRSTSSAACLALLFGPLSAYTYTIPFKCIHTSSSKHDVFGRDSVYTFERDCVRQELHTEENGILHAMMDCTGSRCRGSTADRRACRGIVCYGNSLSKMQAEVVKENHRYLLVEDIEGRFETALSDGTVVPV